MLLGTRMLGTTYSGVQEGLVVAFSSRGLPMVLFVKLALAERCSCCGGDQEAQLGLGSATHHDEGDIED